MKKMLLIALALLSTSVFAASSNSSWNQIENDRSLEVQWPTARMEHGPSTSVSFLCDAGDHFRTLAPVQQCDSYRAQGREGQRVCVSGTKDYGIVEKVQSYERCTRYSSGREHRTCMNYETVTTGTPASYNVKVNRVRGTREPVTTFAFSKFFAIPACN